jgi:hypothetical protein
MTDSNDIDERLTVVCTDGTMIGCENFKAIDSGVLLTEDLKKNRVFGFVNHDEVRFVLPSETAAGIVGDGTADEGFEDPLMQLPGLGSRYAQRLRSAGYTSIGELADADPAVLTEETGANEKRTSEWVERAGEMGNADGSDEDA